jgi:hypothetical protein
VTYSGGAIISPRPDTTQKGVNNTESQTATIATPGALEALAAAGQSADEFLARHVVGDWGDLDQEDREANDAALIDGSRIVSAYQSRKGERIWIITEAADDQGHRSSSTLLLPRDY